MKLAPVAVCAVLVSAARAWAQDVTPPAASTISTPTVGPDRVTLQWTAPGDDGTTGTAAAYDVRYCTTGPITDETDWLAATQATGEPAPQVAGTVQTMTITGLNQSLTYWFALKSTDGLNTSPLSNSPSATLPPYTSYATQFDTVEGWTFANSHVAMGWASDNTNGSVPGGATHGSSRSLNYNDGTDYDNLQRNFGHATSPQVDLSGMSRPTLRFWCNYRTDTTGTATDQRWVRVSKDMFITTVACHQLAGTETGFRQCAAMGTWHKHVIPLDPAWGVVRIRFSFDTMDANDNAHHGWYVDDLEFDPAAPGAVADLSRPNAGSTWVTLRWTAPGEDGATGRAVSYLLRRSTTGPIDSEAAWSAAVAVSGASAPANPGTVQSLTVSGLTNGTDYWWCVRATDDSDNLGALSNALLGPTLDTIAPAPTGLEIVALSDTQVTVRWTATGDDGNAGTASSFDMRKTTYAITSDASFGFAPQVDGEPAPGPPGTVHEMTFTGLTRQQTYGIAIKAVDEAGNASTYSAVSFTTPDTVPPTTVGDMSVTEVTGTSMRLQYTTSGDDGMTGQSSGHEIRRSTSGPITTPEEFAAATLAYSTGALNPGLQSSVVISGLSPSTRYWWSVRFRDNAGNWSGVSNCPDATTLDIVAPAVISTLDAQLDGTTVTLTWTAPGDDGVAGTAAAYDVRYTTRRAINSDAEFSSAKQVASPPAPTAGGTTQSLVIAGLVRGATYWFCIRTRDEVNNQSGRSNVVSVTTAAGVGLRTSFPEIEGWASTAPVGAIEWAVDSTPQFAGPHSAPFSLNFNDGEDYMYWVDDMYEVIRVIPAVGSATSPRFSVPWRTAVKFWCNFATSTEGDDRTLQISNDGFASFLVSARLARSGVPAAQTCAAMGTWHTHTFEIDPAWGVVQVRFHFASDTYMNGYAGWFIDDVEVDVEAPDAVTTLAATAVGPQQVTLQWTATGDDGSSGTATVYDIRYSTVPIDSLASFLAATRVLGVPAPAAAGTVQSVTVGRLFAGTTYYFAMRVADEWQAWSGLSNVISVATAASPDTTPPAVIKGLMVVRSFDTAVDLRWRSVGDDGVVGWATAYDLRWSTSPIEDEAGFAAATPVVGVPQPSAPGAGETFRVGGLAPATTCYFSVRTLDEAYNPGALPASVSADTSAGLSASVDGRPVVAAGVVTADSVRRTESRTLPPSEAHGFTVHAVNGGQHVFALCPADGGGASFDSTLHVFAEDGSLIATNDDHCGLASQVAVALNAGTYYVAVSGNGTASGAYTLSITGSADVTAPLRIEDLTVVETSDGAVTLRWTVPGDDGNKGRATRYDLRYANMPLDEFHFNFATAHAGPPVPLEPGSVQEFTVLGLSPTSNYWFAIRAVDDGGNAAAVSNSPEMTPFGPLPPDETAPSTVVDSTVIGALSTTATIEWTAPGDDGLYGTAWLYVIRYSTSPITTETAFAEATAVAGLPGILEAGNPQSVTVGGLTPGTTYYFVVRAFDGINYGALGDAAVITTAP